MYSRYTPNADGGFDRRQFPDAADLRTAQGRSPPPEPEAVSQPPLAESPPEPVPPEPRQLRRPNPFSDSADRRPLRFRPGPGSRIPGSGNKGPGDPSPAAPGPPLPPGLLGGSEGLLSQLLPHGLDSEDLLILAILLLSMKQDGVGATELLIAIGIYLWL